MKQIYYLLAFILICGCDNFGKKTIVSLVSVTTSSTGELLFSLNDSTLLNPTNYSITATSGQRMLIEYEITQTMPDSSSYNFDIDIINYNIVLTKDVVDLTINNETTIGNDSFWNIYYMNPAGGYLNIYLSLLFNNITHTINLVNNTLDSTVNSTDSIYLELRQNANGDNIGYPLNQLVSFNIDEYLDKAKENGVDTLIVSVSVLMSNNSTSKFVIPFIVSTSNSSDISYNSLNIYEPSSEALN